MKKILLIPFFIIVLFSCKNNKTNFIDFELVKSIDLPLYDNNGHLLYYDYINIDDKESMIVYFENLNDNKLVFYDLNTKKIYNTIKLINKQILGFKYINNDSIFVFYVNQFNLNNNIDSNLLFLYNYEGEIVKRYVYNNELISSNKNYGIPKDSAIFLTIYSKIEVFNNKLFVSLKKNKPHLIGTDSFFISKSPIIAHYDLLTEDLIASYDIWYPGIEKNMYFPSDMPVMYSCLAEDNMPLIRFMYSSNLYKWNYKSGKVDTFNLKTRLTDTIIPLLQPSHYSYNFDGFYTLLFYDKYREIYYSSFTYNPDIYGLGAWSIVFADKNLNYISELYNPILTHWPLFTKDYIINASCDKKGFLTVNFYTLKKTKIDYDKYIVDVKDSIHRIKEKELSRLCEIAGSFESNKDDIIHFFRNRVGVSSNSFKAVSLFTNGGCPPCNHDALRALSMNISYLKDKNIHLIVSGSSKEIESLLKLYGLYLYENLYKDTLNDLSLFHKNNIKNPRFTIFENNELKLDTIYLPEKILEGTFNLLD